MNRLIIGVTGGIASGKSTFLSILGENGFKIISADEIVKRLYEKGAPGYNAIKGLGIADLFDMNAELNKKRLRHIIFSDVKMKTKVEKMIHPLVISQMKEFIESNHTSNIAVEIPLLFEAGLEDMCTHTVTIYAKKEMMMRNIKTRYGATEKEAEEMLASQMDIQTKMKMSGFVIMNNETLDDLRNRTVDFIKNIKGEIK